MTAKASFTVSLATDGSGVVKQGFADTADAAEKSADRIVNAYEKTRAAEEKAEAERAAARQRAMAEYEREFGPGKSAGGPGQTATPAPSPQVPALVDRRKYQAAAQSLADALDPAAKAQRQFDAEVEKAEGLMKAGYVTADQYTAYTAKLREELAKATRNLGEHGAMLGLNRGQYITAQSAVIRFTDMLLAGQNPLRAFALEAHKGAEVLAMDEGGMAGGLAKVTALITPTTVGIAGLTAAILVGGAAAYGYGEALDKLSRMADGFGRTSELTGAQLLAIADDYAHVGQVSTGAARDIEAAVLSQTRTSGDALGQTIAITQRFADAMGVDTAHAAQELGKALADPAKAADELTARFGYLTQAQVDNIHTLMQQNDLTGAQQSLLAGLDGALDKTGEHVNALTSLWRGLTTAMSQGWDNIGAAINHAMGAYSDAEKLGNLQRQIQHDQIAANGPLGSLPGIGDAMQARLREEMTEYAKLAGDADRRARQARDNQLGQDAASVSGKYAVGTDQPRLEALKQDLAKLKDAQRAGQKVDAATLDALQHAVRTFKSPDEQRIAVATATAEMARAAPHSAARQAAAQRLSDARTAGQVVTEAGARALADERGQQALGHERAGSNKHAETLARQAASMEVAARASLDLADAYLKGGDAALKAEAYRKAATDATKKGIDVEAQVRRQLNLAVAEQVANSAKGIRSMEDETASRNRVIDAVRAGTVPARDMQAAMAKETALRPLITLQSVAEGEAKAKLAEIIARETKALNDNEASMKRQAAAQAIIAANDNARADRLRGQLAGERDPVEIARRQAQDEADKAGYTPDDTAKLVAARTDAARAKQAADSAVYVANEQHRIELNRELLDLQKEYASARDPAEVEALARKQLEIQLGQQGIDLSKEQIDQILAEQIAQKKLSDQVERQRAGWQQLRDDGASAMNELLSPDGIENWGQTWHNVIRKILTDLEQLLILNPLENMLFGGSLATIGSGGGLLSSIFGGIFKTSESTGGFTSSTTPLVATEALASGTDSALGGPTIVGEEGPELVNMPRGSSVLTARQTKEALSGGGGSSFHMPIAIDARGAGPREIDALRVELRALRSAVPQMAIEASNNAKQRRFVA